MTLTSPHSELVDHLDDHGGVVGAVTRKEMRARNLRHRTVAVAVLSSRKELLVHRRADCKDVWPSRWDLAFGGVVGAGEAWEDAAARELFEEAGVHAPLEYLGEEAYEDGDVRELARVYLARCDGPFRHADGEVTETAWVPLQELCGWVSRHELCPDNMALLPPRLDAP
jgi:isopentenyldiphosphate isomerase